MIVNDELKRMWKEAVWHLPEGTEENHEKYQSG
jgi:hypothetical protein